MWPVGLARTALRGSRTAQPRGLANVACAGLGSGVGWGSTAEAITLENRGHEARKQRPSWSRAEAIVVKSRGHRGRKQRPGSKAEAITAKQRPSWSEQRPSWSNAEAVSAGLAVAFAGPSHPLPRVLLLLLASYALWAEHRAWDIPPRLVPCCGHPSGLVPSGKSQRKHG